MNITEEIIELGTRYDCQSIIIAGDFNLVFRKEEVKNRTWTSNEQRIANEVFQIFLDLDLEESRPQEGTPPFTWTNSRNGKTMHSTLDRIFCSKNNLVLKSFQIDWSQYQNSFILTTDPGYRIINLIFFKKVSW